MFVRRTPRPRRRGAHLVEFALVAPIFFAFVFGMIDLGRGFMVSSLLTNAARAGCRTAVLPGKTNDDVKTAVTNTLKGQGVNGSTTTITVAGGASDVSGAETGEMVTVTVAVPATNVLWLPMEKFLNGTITGQFAMPHE